MARHLTFGLAVILALTARTAPADETGYGLNRASLLRVGKGKDGYGHCGLCVVTKDGRPMAAFTLDKRPGEDHRYAYLLIFPPTVPAGVGTAVGTAAAVSASNTELSLTGEVLFGGKAVPIKYKATYDEATNKLTSETITLDGKELKKGDPRVYLVDLSGDKPVLKPVKVDLPASVPDLAEEDSKAWGAAVAKGLDQLKEKSPEVKAFLTPKGK
jgi:hypothetical protein